MEVGNKRPEDIGFRFLWKEFEVEGMSVRSRREAWVAVNSRVYSVYYIDLRESSRVMSNNDFQSFNESQSIET